MGNEYTPDKWVILKFKSDKQTYYKVLGSWYGGYTQGDSWRLSSGLERIEQDGDVLSMHNFSGSVYKVNKNSEGMHMTAGGIFAQAVEEGKKQGVEVTQVTVEEFNKEKSNG